MVVVGPSLAPKSLPLPVQNRPLSNQLLRNDMPIQIINRGENNKLLIPESVIDSGKGQIQITGSNNTLIIGEKTVLQGPLHMPGSHCTMHVGDAVRLVGTFRCIGSDSHIRIGSRTSTLGARILLREAGTITIGEDCMFSDDVMLSNSDMHSIVDLNTGKRVNWAADITIEDHVWLGLGVTVLKGVRIGHDSVIGASSLVASDIPPHVVAAGVPAKVVRTDVTWSRQLLPA